MTRIEHLPTAACTAANAHALARYAAMRQQAGLVPIIEPEHLWTARTRWRAAKQSPRPCCIASSKAGKETNKAAAQQALMHRARCNRAASKGEYSAAMEVQ